MTHAAINDGGPAFPVLPQHNGHRPDAYGPGYGSGVGLSLRDYFAAKAIDSAMAEAVEWWKQSNSCDVYARAADGCYRLADAMLLARGGAK